MSTNFKFAVLRLKQPVRYRQGRRSPGHWHIHIIHQRVYQPGVTIMSVTSKIKIFLQIGRGVSESLVSGRGLEGHCKKVEKRRPKG